MLTETGSWMLTSMMTSADFTGSIVMGVVVVLIVRLAGGSVSERVKSKPLSEENFQKLSLEPTVALYFESVVALVKTDGLEKDMKTD
jgi:hypothetical protein